MASIATRMHSVFFRQVHSLFSKCTAAQRVLQLGASLYEQVYGRYAELDQHPSSSIWDVGIPASVAVVAAPILESVCVK